MQPFDRGEINCIALTYLSEFDSTSSGSVYQCSSWTENTKFNQSIIWCLFQYSRRPIQTILRQTLLDYRIWLSHLSNFLIGFLIVSADIIPNFGTSKAELKMAVAIGDFFTNKMIEVKYVSVHHTESILHWIRTKSSNDSDIMSTTSNHPPVVTPIFLVACSGTSRRSGDSSVELTLKNGESLGLTASRCSDTSYAFPWYPFVGARVRG